MTWQLSITGLLIGTLVGLTGMGGGSLMTPILILVFGFEPTLAVGTDILHGAVFKTFGAVRHRRLGTVHARITFWMFLGSAPMSLLGVEVADLVGAAVREWSRDGVREGDRRSAHPRRPRLSRQDVRQAWRPALGRAIPAQQPGPGDLRRARSEPAASSSA